MSAEAALARLNITLPAPAAAVANYVPFVRTGSLLVISGQLPLQNGALASGFSGRLGEGVSPEEAFAAARIAAINVLAQTRAALGSLDRVARVVRLGGYISAVPGYTALPAVMNGASDLMVEVFGEAGRHARTTIGVSELPLGACIEVEAMLEILP